MRIRKTAQMEVRGTCRGEGASLWAPPFPSDGITKPGVLAAWHGTAGLNRSELRAAPGLPQEAAGSPSFWSGRVWLKPARSLGLFGAEGLAHSSLRENRNPGPSRKLRPRRHSYLDCWDRSYRVFLSSKGEMVAVWVLPTEKSKSSQLPSSFQSPKIEVQCFTEYGNEILAKLHSWMVIICTALLLPAGSFSKF